MDTTQTTQSPLATAAVGLATLVAGFVGGQTLDSNTISELNTQVAQIQSDKNMLIAQVDSEKAIKESAASAYVYAMISSGRKPTIDTLPLTDLEQAYIDTVGTTTLKDTDLYQVGVNLAKQRNDFICK